MADDTDICKVVLYHFNLFHVYEEVRQMEHIQFLTTSEKWWKCQILSVAMIVEMWNLKGGKINPDFSHDSNVWRSWVWAVHDVIWDWDGFDQWDWGGFSAARMPGITDLSMQDFHRFTVVMILTIQAMEPA